jgi:UDP-4-amino-4,6-dideoxy-N-acetyl-beta-L-altrosamine transaminase
MTTMIPYGRQDISEEDIDAVVSVLRSDYLTQGPCVPQFENLVAEYCSAEHAVAVNSATSALHIACLALGLGKGDILWTSPITFVASANCALYCGAEIDFVDIDPATYNLSVECLADKLIEAEKVGKLPKIVVPVHLCGQPCHMEAIHSLGKKYGFSIIEDASHAIGAKYKSEPVGNCRFGDITVFSFHPVKIITTGEGGMALTNDFVLAERMRLFRSHGITTNSKLMLAQNPVEIWNYQQVDLGFNYRMTDINAALGISQMRRLDEFVGRRKLIANRYNAELADLPITLPAPDEHSASSCHLYIIRLKLGEVKKSHREVYEFLRAAGVLVNLHYIPVYLQPYYQALGFTRGCCPIAERYFLNVLSIPVYSQLSGEMQSEVIARVKEAVEN